MARRAEKGRDPSDATPMIAARMAALADPWPEAATVATTEDRANVLAEALRLLA
jgi:predicted kinase